MKTMAALGTAAFAQSKPANEVLRGFVVCYKERNFRDLCMEYTRDYFKFLRTVCAQLSFSVVRKATKHNTTIFTCE